MASTAAHHRLVELARALRKRSTERTADTEGEHLGAMPWSRRVAAVAEQVYLAIADSDILTRASALSYAFVLSLIPLVTTTLAFITALPALAPERERLLGLIYSQLLPGAVQEARRYIEQFSNRAAAAGAVSTLLFVIFVLTLFQSVESTFNGIWRVERGRTWGQRLQALAQFFICSALAALALVILDNTASNLAERFRASATVSASPALYELGSLAVAWAVFTLGNKVLPNTRVRWIPAIVGGTLAGTIWHLIKGAFTWYVGSVAHYENVYGTLGMVPAFFLWVYLSFVLLLLAGYVAFVIQNLGSFVLVGGKRKLDQPHAFHAVAAVVALARAFRDGTGPLSAREIAAELRAGEYFVREALPCLAKKGTLIAIPGDDEQRYTLARPSESITVFEVVSQATGEDLQVPEGEERSRLHHVLGELFREARGQEGSVLARVHIADLLGHGEQ